MMLMCDEPMTRRQVGRYGNYLGERRAGGHGTAIARGRGRHHTALGRAGQSDAAHPRAARRLIGLHCARSCRADAILFLTFHGIISTNIISPLGDNLIVCDDVMVF